MRKKIMVGALLAVAMLSGCVASQPQLGGGSSMVTGSAGEGGNQGEAKELTKCGRPIGTATLVEPEDTAYAQHGLTSPVPLLRLMMAQSGCFRVVDRGAASKVIERERALAAGGELRKGSSMGGGQMVAADYVITPSIVFQDADAGGAGGLVGGLLPGVFGLAAGGIQTKNLESQVMLSLTNVRTGVQEAVAEGSAKKRDVSFGGLGFVAVVGGAGGAWEKTDIGKITAAAFLDAHNALVAQVRPMDASTPAAEKSEAGYITTAALNFRSGPNSTAPVLGSLPKGSAVKPTGVKDGAWWEVEAIGKTGWVHSDFVTR